jgi:hypothetical protein
VSQTSLPRRMSRGLVVEPASTTSQVRFAHRDSSETFFYFLLFTFHLRHKRVCLVSQTSLPRRRSRGLVVAPTSTTSPVRFAHRDSSETFLFTFPFSLFTFPFSLFTLTFPKPYPSQFPPPPPDQATLLYLQDWKSLLLQSFSRSFS